MRLATTIIDVTHDRVEAMAMADRIVVLRAGQVELVGSPLDLSRAQRTRLVAGFIGSPRMNLIEGAEAARQDTRSIGIRPEHIDPDGKGHGRARWTWPSIRARTPACMRMAAGLPKR